MHKRRSYINSSFGVVCLLILAWLIVGCGEQEQGVVPPSEGVQMAPVFSILGNGNGKQAVKPHEVEVYDLIDIGMENGKFAVWLMYRCGREKSRIVLEFDKFDITIMHGVYDNAGSCEPEVPDAAKEKIYNAMIPGVSKATADKKLVLLDIDGDDNADYRFRRTDTKGRKSE